MHRFKNHLWQWKCSGLQFNVKKIFVCQIKRTFQRNIWIDSKVNTNAVRCDQCETLKSYFWIEKKCQRSLTTKYCSFFPKSKVCWCSSAKYFCSIARMTNFTINEFNCDRHILWRNDSQLGCLGTQECKGWLQTLNILSFINFLLISWRRLSYLTA